MKMTKLLRLKWGVFAGLLVFVFLSGCSSKQGVSDKQATEKSPEQKAASKNLISTELLKPCNLKIVWENQLPIKPDEKVQRISILGNRIYVLSDRNYMTSLNCEKGTPIFSRPLAQAGFTISGWELYNDIIISMIGGKLVELNPDLGTEIRSSYPGFFVVCPAARNNLYYYLGSTDKRVHCVRANDKVKIFEAAADNDSKITSILADNDSVIFATDVGNVICITPDGPKGLWRFNAAGGVVEPMVRDARQLFFASRDTNVYGIDIKTGKLEWKCQTDAILETAPRVTAAAVYQNLGSKGLMAIDKTAGKKMWQLAEGIDLLTEAAGKAYVITNTGTLVVINNKDGKQLYSINAGAVSNWAANTADSKIYIADDSGRIACIQPIADNLLK
ncbi:MAG: PQQ-binding-like beta-propeller repeat protein [Planctomycetota bacterium]|nr:PQQ-binding-like beta-propeller repeat protein [Planctomycetota bacterium]